MSALLTPAQLAAQWNVSARHIQRLCERRQLRAFRLAGQWRIDATDADVYRAAQANTTAPTPITAAPAESADWTYEPVVSGPVPWRESIAVAAHRGVRQAKKKARAGV